jgi:hypothetical protein
MKPTKRKKLAGGVVLPSDHFKEISRGYLWMRQQRRKRAKK